MRLTPWHSSAFSSAEKKSEDTSSISNVVFIFFAHSAVIESGPAPVRCESGDQITFV